MVWVQRYTVFIPTVNSAGSFEYLLGPVMVWFAEGLEWPFEQFRVTVVRGYVVGHTGCSYLSFALAHDA